MSTSPGNERPRERPCDACRKRKIKCSINSVGEACSLCQSRSQRCTFVQEPPRKKRKADDRLSPTEQTPRPKFRTSSGHGTLPVKDYSSLPGPSLLKHTLGHQNRQSSSFLGLTTDYDPKIVDPVSFDQKDERASPIGTFRRATCLGGPTQAYFMMRPDTISEVEQEMASLDAIEAVVAPHGPALVNLYYRIIHPSFPILHKKVFLEKHGRTYRELTPLGLIAVYIMALYWWSYSPELTSLQKVDVKKLESMVPKMMAECYTRPKMSDLQAGLLLSQRPGADDSWPMTGQLVAMAQNLGIHIDCSNWRVPEWEKGVRKRVAWALFAQDKWGALIYGRPSHIIAANWDVQPLEVADFPETSQDDDDEEGSAEVENGRLIFVHLVSLTIILSDILDAFFTLKAFKYPSSTISILEQTKPLQIRLKSWYSNLPPSLSLNETKSRKLSSTGYLHLAYFTTEITLHRAVIRSLDHFKMDANLVSIVRIAARMRLTAAIDFVKRLRPEHLLSFWYFSSKKSLSLIGTFGNVLLVTSGSHEEREFYRNRLAEYRWTLRISISSADFTKYAMATLDASSTLVSEQPPPVAAPSSIPYSDSEAQPETPYSATDPILEHYEWCNDEQSIYMDGQPEYEFPVFDETQTGAPEDLFRAFDGF